MKIDIEGYEYFSLQSGETIFDEKRINRVIVDIHTQQLKALGISPQQVPDFFEQKGYSFIHEDGIGVFVANQTA